MFSSIKVVVAGALAFAVGGLLFVASPSQDDESAPAAAETEQAAPVPFTAVFVPGFSFQSDDYAFTSELYRSSTRGLCYNPQVKDASDPRLLGLMTVCRSEDAWKNEDFVPATRVWTDTYRIWNDDGAWEGSVSTFDLDASAPADEAWTEEQIVFLTGSGAYEGLTAAADLSDWDDIRGLVIPGPVPAAPTVPIPE